MTRDRERPSSTDGRQRKGDPRVRAVVRETVRRRYAKIARGALGWTRLRAWCCGGTADSPADELACHSLGCGDPVALAALSPGAIVLDLGSGSGIDVFQAARQVGPTGFVYGLDMTDEMLVLAAANARRLGLSNVAFLKGHIEEIPLPDDSVDVIISNCVINLSADKGRALREAHRVLRPGGKLAISDIVLDGAFEGALLTEHRVRSLLRFTWSRCVAGALTTEQYREQLAAAGFDAIGVEVRHRYTPVDLLPGPSRFAAALLPPPLRDVVGRFTRSAIFARRPVRTPLQARAAAP